MSRMNPQSIEARMDRIGASVHGPRYLPHVVLAWLILAAACNASTFSSTQLCWEDPYTTSTTTDLNSAAFADCSFGGSADVVTPGSSGNQVFNASVSAIASPTVWRVSAVASWANYQSDMYQWSTTSNEST